MGSGPKAGLRRFARGAADAPVTPSWSEAIAPIYARSCASCHSATGESGVDLSTAQAWERERALIHERVVLRRSMPPQGHALSEADRATIGAWAGVQNVHDAAAAEHVGQPVYGTVVVVPPGPVQWQTPSGQRQSVVQKTVVQ